MSPVKASLYYVYVLKSTLGGKFYTGFTSDLRKRLLQHETGKSRYTKIHGPYELIYFEACRNVEDAQAREKYLKAGAGKRYLKQRNKRFLALTG